MPNENKVTVALFYCQHTPKSSELDRQSLEQKYGRSLRLFPMPCSSRIEPIHLLRALEEFAGAAYVITCPEGECRYSDGNLRAKKRVQSVREIIVSIGLKGDRVGIVMNSREEPKSLARLVDEIMVAFTRFEPGRCERCQASNGEGTRASTG
jgi:F420-non-reducing hydrogenase iron-sulfur subunit